MVGCTMSSSGWCLAYTHVIATFSEFLEGMNNNRTRLYGTDHPPNIETPKMFWYGLTYDVVVVHTILRPP